MSNDNYEKYLKLYYVFFQTVRVWDVSSGMCLSSFNIGQSTDCTVTTVSYDHGHLAVGSGTMVSLWNLTTGDCVHEFSGHKNR